MKKLISAIVMLCWLSVPAMSQVSGPVSGPGPAPANQRPNGNALEAMKIAFLTKRLNITPEEAQVFWPVYYQYIAEVRQAHKAYREHKNEIKLEEDLLNIKKKYSPGFTKALGSSDRANEFFRADKDFGGIVQKEMQRRQNQVNPRRPPAGEK